MMGGISSCSETFLKSKVLERGRDVQMKQSFDEMRSTRAGMTGSAVQGQGCIVEMNL